ncbi:hypothetical protein TIFTF001_009856 [Ficus carica]|uniref:Uncharacterized protein n=1 Tax=Ficus carica TaxID=3494 RepID=A0AA88D3Z2_FICCA|nr:hypothetical protein TIFTF001_009856 [Ficus carica]
MNDMSGDSENDNLSMEVDITSSFESTKSSKSIDHIANLAGQAGRTPNNLSSISDILTPKVECCASPRATKETDRSPGSGLDWEEDTAAVRTTGQPSTSGHEEDSDEEFESSGSVTP